MSSKRECCQFHAGTRTGWQQGACVVVLVPPLVRSVHLERGTTPGSATALRLLAMAASRPLAAGYAGGPLHCDDTVRQAERGGWSRGRRVLTFRREAPWREDGERVAAEAVRAVCLAERLSLQRRHPPSGREDWQGAGSKGESSAHRQAAAGLGVWLTTCFLLPGASQG